MNLKELIFGKGASSGGEDGVYRDSIQAWLPIKNIIGGVVITKDDRFVKILELLPVNVYLKSANDRQNIVSSFAAYLKIAPNDLQMVARTLPADTQAYVEQMRRFAEQEENEDCREMIEDNIQEIGYGIASDAMRHRFFLVFQYEAMELRRIDAAIRMARERNCLPIALAALDAQGSAVLLARYADPGYATVYKVTDGVLTKLFGHTPALYEPPCTQFLTKKGDVVNAPLIKALGKDRGPRCK